MDLDVDPPDLNRRDALKLAGGGVLAASIGAYALDEPPEPADTRAASEEESRRLAEAYAPTMYFGEHERWYPTDPRPYTSERDGETVVTGFDALDGYTKAFKESGSPPRPTVFYNAVDYPDSPLACVQFWFYSVFDQFSTNFHWHDWEVLHVFVDTDAEASVLLVASAHARKVPNNEYLDPDKDRAAVITEVGSHSSALGVNAEPKSFQRYATESLLADINNRTVEITESGTSLPLAYGLPRDEGLGLPYVVPELDGSPVYEDDRLPNVDAEDLLPGDLTVHSYGSLATPPTDLPTRDSRTAFAPAAASGDGDVEYDLVNTSEVEHIDDLVGPQLSFEFYVPKFAEDAVASHLTTTDVPWSQPRYENPAADITDPAHRQALADRYEPINADDDVRQILGSVRQLTGADEAPTNSGVAAVTPGIEVVALLESEPTAAPSFSGVVAFEDPPAGDHRLTVNGAGMAPYSEELTVESGTHRVGVDGEVSMAANEDAVKVRADASDPGLAGLALEDDFGGKVFDGSPPGEDRFGIYAHRGGAYTADVTDPDGNRGAVRVNPDADESDLLVEEVRTGKAAMTDYLRTVLTETRGQTAVFEDGTEDGITDVTTGTDIDEETIASAVEAAKSNLEERLDDVADGVTGVRDGDDHPTGEGTATETATPGSETPASGTPTPDSPLGDSFSPGTGFTGLLKAADAALLTAVRAHAAAADGNADLADRRLETLQSRLGTIQRVVERSQLPASLAALIRNRTTVVRARVETAIEAEVC